jgi:hypothetical protein
VASVKGVSLYDKSLDLSECIFWKKIIFLVNLTSAVYIHHSGYTLTFGVKSKGTRALLCLQDVDRVLIKTKDDLHPRVEPRTYKCSESDRRLLKDERSGVL